MIPGVMRASALSLALLALTTGVARAEDDDVASTGATATTSTTSIAAGAVAATVAQASRTGITYRHGGRLVQRNAAGTVFVSLDDGAPTDVVLKGPDGAYRLYGAAGGDLEPYPAIAARAYGMSNKPLVETSVLEPDQVTAFTDPWTWASSVPDDQVVTDADGRLLRIESGGEIGFEVLGYSAPKAVQPAANRLYSMDMDLTVQDVGREGRDLADEAAHVLQSASVKGTFRGDPVGTLRRTLVEYGWPYRVTRGGAQISVRGMTGATWTATFAVVPSTKARVRMALSTLPPVVPQDIRGVQVEVGAVPAAVSMLAGLSRLAGLPGPTPTTAGAWLAKAIDGRPDGDGRIVHGRETMTYAVTGAPWRLRFAVGSDGQCVDAVLDPKAPRLREYVVAAGSPAAGGTCAS